jgi:hypothetical protein
MGWQPAPRSQAPPRRKGLGGFGICRNQKALSPQGLSLQEKTTAGVNAWKNQGTPGAKPSLTPSQTDNR